MDMILMESFVAVVDAGSITATADRIHMSQPAPSRRLRQLEDDLGASLLVRGRHGVELTAVGSQVLEHGRRLLSRFERRRQDINEHLSLDQGTIRIGGGGHSDVVRSASGNRGLSG
ncbi:MAG: LysR family transcriptional regulator [Actinomycetota bacterium]|nr:LysR family transcriptional regulator [Actinomycetota bacterium]